MIPISGCPKNNIFDFSHTEPVFSKTMIYIDPYHGMSRKKTSSILLNTAFNRLNTTRINQEGEYLLEVIYFQIPNKIKKSST